MASSSPSLSIYKTAERESPSKISKKTVAKTRGIELLKKGIWTYLILLVLEGALRKWILPGLSSPLLIIRDPVAIWLILLSLRYRLFRINPYIASMWIVGALSLTTTIFWGHGNWSVAFFGLRIFLLHFPLIFIIGRVFDKNDVTKIGKVLLWVAVPMTILMIVQFYSPQSAWVNRGVGDNYEGAGFGGALGYFRPPGTFSFITGLVQFYSLVTAFTFCYWLDDSKSVPRLLLFVVSGCLILSIPFSISRSLFFSAVVSFLFAMVAAWRTPKYFSRLVFASVGVLLVLIVVNQFNFFQTGLEVFNDRFESANANEGGVDGVFFDRFLGGMIGAVLNSSQIPFWGLGLGMGTNAGAALLTGSSDVFLISEGEWGRLIGEMGLILGLFSILVRIFLSIRLTIRSFQALFHKNLLPWMLLSCSIFNVLQGQWAQPTSLGFTVFSAGLILAGLKDRKRAKKTGFRSANYGYNLPLN